LRNGNFIQSENKIFVSFENLCKSLKSLKEIKVGWKPERPGENHPKVGEGSPSFQN